MKRIKILFTRIFRRKPKPYLLDNTYSIVPAFEWEGKVYYMHSDPMNTATGRGLTALMFMEELLMRCSHSYLKAHAEACNKIFSNPKSIDLPMLMKLNNNLSERVELLGAMPQHVYKLASIVFFTKDESPYKYDRALNAEKIKAWSEGEGMYDFFCQGHLKTLMPFLALPKESSEKFSQVASKINHMHLKTLSKVLSGNLSATDL